MEIGTEAAQFPEKEYINGIFLAVLFHEGYLLLLMKILVDLSDDYFLRMNFLVIGLDICKGDKVIRIFRKIIQMKPLNNVFNKKNVSLQKVTTDGNCM